MPRDDLHFRLRIPDSLKAKVESAATANHRSITAEIIFRLDASFSEAKPDLRELITSIVHEVILALDQKTKSDR